MDWLSCITWSLFPPCGFSDLSGRRWWASGWLLRSCGIFQSHDCINFHVIFVVLGIFIIFIVIVVIVIMVVVVVR